MLSIRFAVGERVRIGARHRAPAAAVDRNRSRAGRDVAGEHARAALITPSRVRSLVTCSRRPCGVARGQHDAVGATVVDAGAEHVLRRDRVRAADRERVTREAGAVDQRDRIAQPRADLAARLRPGSRVTRPLRRSSIRTRTRSACAEAMPRPPSTSRRFTRRSLLTFPRACGQPRGDAIEVGEPRLLAVGLEERHHDLPAGEPRAGDEAVARRRRCNRSCRRSRRTSSRSARWFVELYSISCLPPCATTVSVGSAMIPRSTSSSSAAFSASAISRAVETLPRRPVGSVNLVRFSLQLLRDLVHRGDQLVAVHAGGARECGRCAVVARDQHRAQQVGIAKPVTDRESRARAAARLVASSFVISVQPSRSRPFSPNGHRHEDLGGRRDRSDLVGILAEDLVACLASSTTADARFHVGELASGPNGPRASRRCSHDDPQRATSHDVVLTAEAT